MHMMSLQNSRTFTATLANGFPRSMVAALVSRRTWAELAYTVTDPLAAVVGFAFIAAVGSLGAPFAIAAAGIPVTAGLAGTRRLAAAERLRARMLLGLRLPRLPSPPDRKSGYFGWVRPALADAAGWRAVAYLILHLPCSLLAFSVAAASWGSAFGCLASPLWLMLTGNPLPMPRMILLLAVGTILLLTAPWAVHGAVTVSKLLLTLTLDPPTADQPADWRRLRQLELARGHAIENSAEMLRRIERDLHDGAQARLVAMTMRLSVMREQLASARGPGADTTRELLHAVHRDATLAMVELRNVVRNIRPPALDGGLGAAIDSLAAHSPVPIELRVSMTQRPSPGIETIAYFCTAELLANICTHSHADYARIEIAQQDQVLRLQVTDNGVGGARAEAASGLTTLADRVRSVDGTLSVHSPPGGPTQVTAELPLQL
jgi:signal transduction histidine kinase